MPDDKVIRICLTCGKVYLDTSNNLTVVKTCKYCERVTGFFENLNHFFKYIEKYGLDTDQIDDQSLLNTVCQNFEVES